MTAYRYHERLDSGCSGNITPIAAAVIALLVTMGMFAVDLGMIFASRCAAQNAADAVALACLQEAFPLFSRGEFTPEDMARNAADSNGAEIIGLKISDRGEEVTVTVERPAGAVFLHRVGLAPDSTKATATARVDLDKLMEDTGVWPSMEGVGTPDFGLMPDWSLPILAGGSNPGTAVVILALQQMGKPYVYAASGPNAFDCSGLVWYVYRQLGIDIPRTSYTQARSGIPVLPSELQPGDLVLFRGNGHVGLYAGNGKFIHAPRTGERVCIADLGSRRDLSCCRRIIR